MSSELKPIKVWGQDGPNPSKVAIFLEELGLTSDVVALPFSDVKTPEYVAINPNGRLPSILDPNTGITLWESGAIIEYLIERYDIQHKLSFAPGTTESYHAKQWLFFQTTGQAPYFGQAVWFTIYHPEQIPSVKKRYYDEINRVTGVLELHLGRQQKEHGSSGDGPWLVGNKLSYADLSFASWQYIITVIIGKEEYDVNNFPLVKEWMGKLTARESVKKALDIAHKKALDISRKHDIAYKQAE